MLHVICLSHKTFWTRSVLDHSSSTHVPPPFCLYRRHSCSTLLLLIIIGDIHVPPSYWRPLLQHCLSRGLHRQTKINKQTELGEETNFWPENQLPHLPNASANYTYQAKTCQSTEYLQLNRKLDYVQSHTNTQTNHQRVRHFGYRKLTNYVV